MSRIAFLLCVVTQPMNFTTFFRRTVSKLVSQPNFFHDRLSSFLARSGCDNMAKAVILMMTMITTTVMVVIMTVVMMMMMMMMMMMYFQKEIATWEKLLNC